MLQRSEDNKTCAGHKSAQEDNRPSQEQQLCPWALVSLRGEVGPGDIPGCLRGTLCTFIGQPAETVQTWREVE
ncbi:MAG: hypothetical protein FRX49_10897 [Trebouxia sp. A1-2]|nr:MAG: hypothetical protein FRX49_10897 [Trebouxia sp. A1-2]